MADEKKRITLLNRREGKVVLPPSPEDLKNDPKNAKPRVLLAGESLTVSADEAPVLMRHKMLVDAATVLQGAESPEVARLKAALAASEEENAKLKDAAKARASSGAKAFKPKKGDKVLLPDETTGVVVALKNGKKGPEDDAADVKRDDNGNVSPFLIKDLRPAPEA